jgi:TRAP-type uncharacterized transport system fused permease subunit
MALPAFLIAYCMAFQPAIILIGPWSKIIMSVIFCFCGVFCMTLGLQGYFAGKIPAWRRVVWTVAGIMLIAPELISSVVGLVVGGGMFWLEKSLAKPRNTNLQAT